MAPGKTTLLTDAFSLGRRHIRTDNTLSQEPSFFDLKEHGIELKAAMIRAEFQAIWDLRLVIPPLQIWKPEWLEHITGKRFRIAKKLSAELKCVPKPAPDPVSAQNAVAVFIRIRNRNTACASANHQASPSSFLSLSIAS